MIICHVIVLQTYNKKTWYWVSKHIPTFFGGFLVISWIFLKQTVVYFTSCLYQHTSFKSALIWCAQFPSRKIKVWRNTWGIWHRDCVHRLLSLSGEESWMQESASLSLGCPSILSAPSVLRSTPNVSFFSFFPPFQQLHSSPCIIVEFSVVDLWRAILSCRIASYMHRCNPIVIMLISKKLYYWNCWDLIFSDPVTVDDRNNQLIQVIPGH